MKRKLLGFKRGAVKLDFDLYRVEVPIPGYPGARLSVVDLQPEAFERTIVFVHGYAGVAETWDYQLEHFAGSYRVVAPDLRGHGLSDAPDSRWIIHTEAKTYMIADGGEIGGLAADAAWAMAADANQVKSAPL